MLAAIVLLGAVSTGAFAFTQDGDFLKDVMRALFGLSGGNTAGGQ